MRDKHVTGDGRTILIKDMTDNHLLNTIRLFSKKMEEGLVVRSGGGSCLDDFWYDEDVFYGKEAEQMIGLDKYKKEAKRRGFVTNM